MSTIYPANDGLDGRFHDSAARQFHHQVVADFVFGHGCGNITRHAEKALQGRADSQSDSFRDGKD